MKIIGNCFIVGFGVNFSFTCTISFCLDVKDKKEEGIFRMVSSMEK